MEDVAQDGPVLYRDGRAVGRLRYSDPELTEALNLADGLARSPASIASFLEAAGSAALEQAGKILVRGTLDVYEQDAIKCGKLTDPTQYNACHDTAFKKYWTCHENCEQGAALSCTDMFVACKDKGWPCTKQIDKKKTLCAFCLDDCNADRPYKFSQCYTCGFR